MKISRRVSKLLSRHNLQTEIFKKELFHKNIDGVMVLALCISYDGALCLY